MHHHNIELARYEWPQKPSSRFSRGAFESAAASFVAKIM
jgi:hypothetical protein